MVAHERADLEEARSSLLSGMARDRQTLQKLEDTLLRELSHASGNILDNQVRSISLALRFSFDGKCGLPYLLQCMKNLPRAC